MPGMMNTILNLGLSDASVEGLAKKTGNPRFAYDGYRRVIDMFGSTAMGVEHELVRARAPGSLKEQKGVKLDTDLSGRRPQGAGQAIQGRLQEAQVGDGLPAGPDQAAPARHQRRLQLAGTARRPLSTGGSSGSRGLKGTAVNVQAMVFGNMGNTSGTGVAFTRDPNTGEDVFYGDYLINAQGEDVVAGIRTPEPISRPRTDDMPKVYRAAHGASARSSSTHYKEMQDIEFTVQDGTLYMLQTRTGKRTGSSAVREHRRRDGQVRA